IDYISVSPDLTLADFVDQYVYKHYQQNFPVVDHDKLVGLISVQSIMELDRKKWSWTHIRSQMTPAADLDTVSPMTSASEVLDSMQRLSQTTLLVTDNKKLVGIINLNDIVNYLSILQKLDQQRIIGNSAH
ncbi:MAG: CBS domain-containing protein, partial [Pseudomonadota bacterium]